MSEPLGSVGWPGGARAAISLTYDGGLPDHLLLVEPLLRALRMKATFYLSATFFLENPQAWAGMATSGHEIGNHSLFGVTGSRGELPNWTLEMVDTDLQMTESLLRDYVPGPVDRSFGYPGDHPTTAEGSYESVVEQHFRWARTRQEGLNHAVFCNVKALRAIPSFGLSGAGMVQKAEEALDLGAWGIFVFEGMGRGIDHCGERDHELLLRHLSARSADVHIAPVRDIAEYVVSTRERMTVR
jgi:peptidoglycan/xylan/chitin deacetylase (PgdA/CDA1 family)